MNMHPKVLFSITACVPVIFLAVVIKALPEGNSIRLPLLGLQLGILAAQVYCFISALRNKLF